MTELTQQGIPALKAGDKASAFYSELFGKTNRPD
jgi:hypothetical protein